MKKCWKLYVAGLLALCLLTGCGAPAVPERQPLAPAVPSDAGAAVNDAPAPPPGADLEQAPGETQPTQPPAAEAVTPQAPVEPTTQPPTEMPTEAPTQPDPVPPENQTVTSTELTCTLTIRCDKLVGNPELDPDKAELVPADGMMFTAQTVFYEGESVFNVLQRTLKQNRQHLEFQQTPMYNSAYIEGICNLYAYDAGALSGWMYSVNGVFPNYGCSQYQVQAGDVIEWHYTCDLGADLGAAGLGGNNQ